MSDIDDAGDNLPEKIDYRKVDLSKGVKILEETNRHFKAFCCYVALGDDRSLKVVAELLHASQRAVELWSRSFGWQERLAGWDKEERDSLAKTVKLNRARQKDSILKQRLAMLYSAWYQRDEDGNEILDKDGNKQINPKLIPETPEQLLKLQDGILTMLGMTTQITEERGGKDVAVKVTLKDVMEKAKRKK